MRAARLSKLAIVYHSTDTLLANPRNARTHSKHQIRQIAACIREVGFTNPVLIDGRNTIIAGHGRVEAAKLERIEQVPTILLESLTEDQIRAYTLADNRLAEKAGWDKEILAIELQHLLNIDDLDVTITGFEVPEIDLILHEARKERDQDDVVDVDETGRAVTHAGDLWKLDRHRLICGDALEDDTYQALMTGRRAAAVFTDPPYNDPIDGYVTGFGKIHHAEFAMAAGEMSEAEFTEFLTKVCVRLAHHCSDGALVYIFMDWRHTRELLAAAGPVFTEFKSLCVWDKKVGGQGSLYRSQHELVFVFKNGKGRHRNNIQLGQYGRYRTNVWEYPRVNSLSRKGEEGNLATLHPTVKPVALVADAILDCSARRDIVLDSFLGSGTTLVAAERVGRICYGIELDPLYVDAAIRRWQRYTGDYAVHAVTGKRFDEIATNDTEAHHG
jgi:DNA modification methylase